MFGINVPVMYRGRRFTAVGFCHATQCYQLRGGDGSPVFAPESALKVVA